MSTTHDPIRQALLEAADRDLTQAQTEPVSFSEDYLRWEQDFLRNSPGAKTRLPWKRGLSIAACLLLVVSLSFAGGIWASAQVRASVPENSPIPTATGLDVTIQLDGPHGCVYTSEKFACVEENGNCLEYWYQNDSTSPCTVQLFRVGLFQDEYATDAMRVEAGQSAASIYTDPGNDVYYLRVTSLDGMGAYVNGRLTTGQYYLSDPMSGFPEDNTLIVTYDGESLE